MDLSREPDRSSPGGETEIRYLPGLPAADFAHATLGPQKVSPAAILKGQTELYYVLEGEGELWRRRGGPEEVTRLRKGRSVGIPPGVDYQYRSGHEPLRLLVASLPAWRRDAWHESSAAHWDQSNAYDELKPPIEPDTQWLVQDARFFADYLAPDRSEIRQLVSTDEGGIAHCLVSRPDPTAAQKHRSVEEIWYVLDGEGELWRGAPAAGEEVVELVPGRAATIPPHTGFQFRCTTERPLQLLIGTFPRWPGPDEAEPASGTWPPP
jgi:mannose-6-phosphate isomerase-like protein (cupin superfamily)